MINKVSVVEKNIVIFDQLTKTEDKPRISANYSTESNNAKSLELNANKESVLSEIAGAQKVTMPRRVPNETTARAVWCVDFKKSKKQKRYEDSWQSAFDSYWSARPCPVKS